MLQTPRFLSLDLIFVFLLSFLFLLSKMRPPGGVSENKKTPSHSQEGRDVLLAPGVGFEPTRPEGAQADRRAYSRHGPAC